MTPAAIRGPDPRESAVADRACSGPIRIRTTQPAETDVGARTGPGLRIPLL